MAENQASAGWYPDPAGDATKLRYWDGSQWTDQVQDATATASAQTPEQAAVQSSAQAPEQTPVQNPVQSPAQVAAQNPISGQPVQPGQPAQPGQPGQNPYQNQPVQAPIMAQAKDRAGMAIASLVLGILSPLAFLVPIISIILGILAIVFGVMSLKSSKRTLAIIGIIIGSAGILIAIILTIVGTIAILSTGGASYYY